MRDYMCKIQRRAVSSTLPTLPFHLRYRRRQARIQSAWNACALSLQLRSGCCRTYDRVGVSQIAVCMQNPAPRRIQIHFLHYPHIPAARAAAGSRRPEPPEPSPRRPEMLGPGRAFAIVVRAVLLERLLDKLLRRQVRPCARKARAHARRVHLVLGRGRVELGQALVRHVRAAAAGAARSVRGRKGATGARTRRRSCGCIAGSGSRRRRAAPRARPR
jgi:hypothetical protein